MEERLRTARILASDDEEDEEHTARRRRTRTQIERDLNNPKVHKRIVENLYFAYKMRKERKKNYVSLFSFIIFVCFYLTILFLQRKAGEAYRLTSTLNSVLIPQKKELTSSQEIIDWASGVVSTLWTDAICGDGVCSDPFEFPEYGRFGCKADCLRWIELMNVTEVQLDLYYNFTHPRGSVNPVDLQADATWNLCPKEQDEITGIAKIRHGKDCYYETEQTFPSQTGQVQVLLDDVPDGRWAVQIKKDMFLKVGGAIRDRQNVTHEEKRHRVLLAHHYANVARKHQKKILEKLRVDFLDLGKGFAHKTLDELHESELTNLKAATANSLSLNGQTMVRVITWRTFAVGTTRQYITKPF